MSDDQAPDVVSIVDEDEIEQVTRVLDNVIIGAGAGVVVELALCIEVGVASLVDSEDDNAIENDNNVKWIEK